MMGKQLYKVELTGWVVKNDEDSDVMNWSIEAITNDMVGFEIQATLVDSSEWTHVPIITTNETEATTTTVATITTVTDGQVGINVQDVVTPTGHLPSEYQIGQVLPRSNTNLGHVPPTTNEAETTMDIELDTKGMSL